MKKQWLLHVIAIAALIMFLIVGIGADGLWNLGMWNTSSISLNW